MIEVLKQALVSFKKDERHLNHAETQYWLQQYKLLAEDAIKAIAELESQEPMATIAVRWHEPVGKVAYVLEVNLPVGVHKLYTHPTRRTWVGLTDEEATEVYAETEKKVNEHWESGGTTMMFPPTLYKAIEQALKDKNND